MGYWSDLAMQYARQMGEPYEYSDEIKDPEGDRWNEYMLGRAGAAPGEDPAVRTRQYGEDAKTVLAGLPPAALTIGSSVAADVAAGPTGMMVGSLPEEKRPQGLYINGEWKPSLMGDQPMPAAAAVEQVQNALTIQPKGEAGKRVLSGIGNALSTVVEPATRGADYFLQEGTDAGIRPSYLAAPLAALTAGLEIAGPRGARGAERSTRFVRMAENYADEAIKLGPLAHDPLAGGRGSLLRDKPDADLSNVRQDMQGPAMWQTAVPENEVPLGQTGVGRYQRGSVEDTGAGKNVLATQAGRNVVTNTEELGREANALNAGLNRSRGTQSLNRADYIYGDTPAKKPNSRRIVDVGIELQEEALDAWGGKPMDMTPENARTVADNMTEEAAASFERRPEMSGWYKANLDEAMTHASKIHPELATDPKSQSAFKFIMAITSNGQEVPLNAKLTNQYYDQWKKTGQFPVTGSGKERAAMEKSFETANRLVEDMGYEGFDNFLDQEFTVRELQEAGFKVSGENLDTKVKGSVIFGPKIGGGFMQNLRGNYDPPTFDRWWQRTYGRHTGTLISDPQKIGDQIEAFRDIVEDLITDGAEGAFKEVGMTARQALNHPEEAARVIYDRFQKGGFKEIEKTPLNNASRNLVKSLDNVVDAPAGGNQREFMRGVILQVRDNLRARGIDVDTADVQALLWYSEKDLYGKMGAFTNTDTVDYATVWKQLAEQGQEGSNALNRGTP